MGVHPKKNDSEDHYKIITNKLIILVKEIKIGNKEYGTEKLESITYKLKIALWKRKIRTNFKML